MWHPNIFSKFVLETCRLSIVKWIIYIMHVNTIGEPLNFFSCFWSTFSIFQMVSALYQNSKNLGIGKNTIRLAWHLRASARWQQLKTSTCYVSSFNLIQPSCSESPPWTCQLFCCCHNGHLHTIPRDNDGTSQGISRSLAWQGGWCGNLMRWYYSHSLGHSL